MTGVGVTAGNALGNPDGWTYPGSGGALGVETI